MKLFNIAIGTYVVVWTSIGYHTIEQIVKQKQILNDMVYEREEMLFDPSIYQSFTLAYKHIKDTTLSIEEFIAVKLNLSLDFVTMCITQKLTVFVRKGKRTDTMYLLAAPSKAVSMLMQE